MLLKGILSKAKNTLTRGPKLLFTRFETSSKINCIQRNEYIVFLSLQQGTKDLIKIYRQREFAALISREKEQFYPQATMLTNIFVAKGFLDAD